VGNLRPPWTIYWDLVSNQTKQTLN
jgi:hypothetical protein